MCETLHTDSHIHNYSIPSRLGIERQLPAQALEAREPAIVGGQDEPVLDGEGSQMGVRDVAVMLAAFEHEAFEDLVMSRSGGRDEDGVAVEPLAHDPPGIGEGGRELVDSRVYGEAEKGEKAPSPSPCSRASVTLTTSWRTRPTDRGLTW